MANPEHLDILKQGIEVWNQWRRSTYKGNPDLQGSDFSNADFRVADFHYTNLSSAIFVNGDLSFANLFQTNLKNTSLVEANLSNAYLVGTIRETNLSSANLTDANLMQAVIIDSFLAGANLLRANISNAELHAAHLRRANLTKANLRNTFIENTDLTDAILNGADLSNALIKDVIFGNVDLSKVIGLETVRHSGPSTIGIDTIFRSKGNIPKIFLKRAGVPDEFITYMRSLVNNPIEFYSCFISFSSKNQDFADRIYADFQNNNIRCWYAPEDLKIGDNIRDSIDNSIRYHDKLLLILSEGSVESAWVENEVEAALERERREDRLVLFPITLDEAVMETTKAWGANIRRSRHIGDFRKWKNHDDYQKAFSRVLRDLKQNSSKG